MQTCSWPNCRARINNDKLMCMRHWKRLPAHIRKRIAWRWDLRREENQKAIDGTGTLRDQVYKVAVIVAMMLCVIALASFVVVDFIRNPPRITFCQTPEMYQACRDSGGVCLKLREHAETCEQ